MNETKMEGVKCFLVLLRRYILHNCTRYINRFKCTINNAFEYIVISIKIQSLIFYVSIKIDDAFNTKRVSNDCMIAIRFIMRFLHLCIMDLIFDWAITR